MGGSLYYVHSDLLGSTVAVSDAASQAVGRVQYDPYGEVITSTLPTDLIDRLFTGARFDGTIGLYQMGARWYDPTLGRWIQPDTIVPDYDNPQALNRYSYVLNNPVIYTDPSGHCIPGVNCPGDLYEDEPVIPPPPPLVKAELSLQDAANYFLPFPPKFYDTLATGGDVLQVLIDVSCIGVVWTWTIAGGVAGTPGGEFTVPVTGAAAWGWGELVVQPGMKANDLLGIASSTSNMVGDIKAGLTNVELYIAAFPQEVLLRGSVQIAPTTANDWLLTLVGLHPLADIAEVSLVLDVVGLLQDFDIVGPWPVRQTIRREGQVEIVSP